MLLQPAGEKYPCAMRILHWLMALLIIGLLILGLIMSNQPRGAPNHGMLVSLHKSFGLTVLALAVLRLGIRLAQSVPPLPEIIPALQRIAAHLAHWALYGFMFVLPISGYIMSTSYGLPVRWFGYTLPKLVGVDKDRGELAWDVHSWGAYALIALIVLHVGGVIVHYLSHHINLLRRMW
jgi:cytochrome b561